MIEEKKVIQRQPLFTYKEWKTIMVVCEMAGDNDHLLCEACLLHHAHILVQVRLICFNPKKLPSEMMGLLAKCDKKVS